MLRLLVAACLLAAAVAQQPQFYYCNSTAPVTIRDQDFYLVTRRSSRDSGYSPGMVCEFIAEANTKFMIEIQSFNVSSAALTITSGVLTLFRGSTLPTYQSNIATPTSSLRVRFDSTGDYSGRAGVVIRVTVFDSNGCPPGWTYMYNNCFGTNSKGSSLNFADAQKSCNSMRSNLLEIPSSYFGSMTSFVQSLPSRLVGLSYTWVGLTDNTADGRFIYYWLSGTRQYQSTYISCVSGGFSSSCYSYERCGTFSNRLSYIYAVYMADCSQSRPYLCSTPPGGTDRFYSVPNYSNFFQLNFSWIVSLMSSFVFVACLVAIGLFVRSRRRLLLAGAHVVLVTPPPPPGCYPPGINVGGHGTYYPPLNCPQQPPPTYSATTCDGHGYVNTGYGK